jgi:N-acetylmuramoyl-L-alanine amidase
MRRASLIFLSVFTLAALFHNVRIRAADSGFPIYFGDSTLIVTPQIVNRTTYLPLVEIVRHLKIPYTDAVTLETFTIRGPNARLVLTKNSGLISINDQIVLMRNPILRQDNEWLAPVEFLSQGLARVAGIEFRNRPGTSRVFAGNVNPSELVMNAQPLGPVTRVTLRSEKPVKLALTREGQRAVFKFDAGPMDPLRERLDVRDRLLRSIAFDDADGTPKLVAETSDLVADVRMTAAEDNHVYFIDFARSTATTANTPPPPVNASAAPDPNAPAARAPARGVRVIVIDPGHGGTDVGGKSGTTLEKDLTLAFARKLKAELQTRLGATVLLTRDADLDLNNEARSAVANNNQADLLIILHIGNSVNQLESGSSVYVMKEDFATKFSPAAARDRLFLPWYLGYRSSRNVSQQIAQTVQAELSKALPGWKFPLRSGPIAVLASARMPSVALELGNLNNPVNTQTLLDSAFQSRVASTIAAAIERFAGSRQAPSSF